MNDDKQYEEWKRRRAEGDAPASFADRVMAAIESREVSQRQRTWLATVLFAALSSRVSKIGICSLAAAACLFRLLHVFAIFVAQ
jgi:hypothetical protein